jgi:hypothetical protein
VRLRLALVAMFGGLAVAGCGGSASHTTTVIKKPAAVTRPIHDRHKPRPVETTTPTVTSSTVGSPPVRSSPPKVDSSQVVSYLAGAAGVDASTTTCSYETDWYAAQHTASVNGIELPSDTPWETYTCTTVDANYFVVYEDLSSGWTATDDVETS